MNSILTPRLLKIAEMVPAGSKVIDVGSDHAYVPIYLALEKKILCALATDVHEGPLRRAAENILCYGLSDVISTRKADGLSGVDTTGFDTVIIAGMGGVLISDILSAAGETDGKTFILQPMTGIRELREYLTCNNYIITEEGIVQEEEKLYTVIKAEKGKDIPYTEVELVLGRKNKSEPLYPLLRAQILKKLIKKLSGKQKAKNQDADEIQAIKNLIEEMEK